MSKSYLTQRGRLYHLRLRVPADLWSIFGRREVHRSLRTTDARVARPLARTLQAEAEAAFATIRHRKALGDDPASILEIARTLYAEQLIGTRRNTLLRNAYGTTTRSNAPRLVSEAISAYENDRGARWTPKTKLMHGAAFKLLLAIIGDKPIAAMTRADCRTFRDTMALLPPNMTKRLPGLTITQVLDRKLPPMSAKTVNKNMSAVSGLFAWCVREGLLSDSPARGLAIRLHTRADLERDGFCQDELRLIFTHLNAAMGARYWLPLIALYSGMRLEEIAQLRVKDIREVQGVWVFDINAEAGHLKTTSSARLVPIHPELVARGLLEHHAARRRLGEGRLWPDLSRGADGFYSSPFSKWFGRFRRRIGITNLHLTFHSFRHTFVNALKQRGTDELIIKELVGHANTSITTGRYGKRLEPTYLLNALNCLSFLVDEQHRNDCP